MLKTHGKALWKMIYRNAGLFRSFPHRKYGVETLRVPSWKTKVVLKLEWLGLSWCGGWKSQGITDHLGESLLFGGFTNGQQTNRRGVWFGFFGYCSEKINMYLHPGYPTKPEIGLYWGVKHRNRFVTVPKTWCNGGTNDFLRRVKIIIKTWWNKVNS